MMNTETPEKIHRAIEKKISLGSSYIDALVEYAHDKNIEIETVADIVKKSSVIKEKIKSEAKSKRLLKEQKDDERNFFE